MIRVRKWCDYLCHPFRTIERDWLGRKSYTVCLTCGLNIPNVATKKRYQKINIIDQIYDLFIWIGNTGGVKVSPFFAWFDFWIGAYYDRKNQTLYICPLPMCGFKIEEKDNKK